MPAVTIHDDWRATDVDVHSTQGSYLDNEAALLVESPNLLDRPSRTTCERRFKECMLEVLRLARKDQQQELRLWSWVSVARLNARGPQLVLRLLRLPCRNGRGRICHGMMYRLNNAPNAADALIHDCGQSLLSSSKST